MMNVREIAETVIHDNGIAQYTVEPSRLYPTVVARIKEVLDAANIEEPEELVYPAEDYASDFDRGNEARRIVQQARDIPVEAFEYALLPRNEFTDDDDRLALRNRVLELALSWFSLACRVDAPAHVAFIEVTRDLDYKL